MNRRALALALVLVLLCPAGAWAAETLANCESPERGADLIACAAAQQKTADAALNNVYRALRASLQERQEGDLERRLVLSQRDWLRHVQTHCEFEATYEGAGGSFISAKLGNCMASMTEARTKYLEGLLAYFR